MINEETSINELYDKIDQKVSSVKNNVSEGETKEFFCESCGRPIRHRGNCMACNIIAKREREGK
ncbi:MAG: hypothetical protein BWY36_00680 [Candidatus Diapherotrites archaeon ADurb.Bin253]|nr:MAG: hypothetical protein BWY36_00680 [Candidatus Diapherotrites archaeon ADurb.Bin253]